MITLKLIIMKGLLIICFWLSIQESHKRRVNTLLVQCPGPLSQCNLIRTFTFLHILFDYVEMFHIITM